MTDKSHSLESACKDFNVSRKTHPEEHGKITKEYIDYNINDAKITAELYQSALERYEMFNLPDPVNRLYSPASIGKAYLKKIGIKPFMELNETFPKDVLGYVMSSYYGGRTEVRIKDKAIPITYLDFTSMYPSLYSLLGLDSFLKTEKIEYKHSKEKVITFLNTLRIKDLQNKDVWKNDLMHSIVLICPKDDILPVRAEYSKEAKNIGINYLKSDKPLWYSIQDVIASKILSGKMPEIVDAITFYSQGIQENLKDVMISDITITKEDDFIQKVIEKRIEIKQSEIENKDQVQLILKIIANATSYGIYIEESPEKMANKADLDIYFVDSFKFPSDKTEKTGSYFNPIMASLIISASRLLLTMAESIAESKGYFAYCDNDSIFVKPEIAKEIQEFFKPLNPYNVDVEMFKIETDDNKLPLANVMFYGISVKRYCLYQVVNNEIEILKYSTHGLGHLKDIDGKRVWKDILIHSFKKYNDRIAV
ncbi:MAG: hypothetical protein QW783_02995 [Candidatus Micrarchaeia archaeon]